VAIGALNRYKVWVTGGAEEMSESNKPVIEAAPNGPYVVNNPPTLNNSKGEELPTKPVTKLCRCGRSSNKPFCDGTHAKVGFDSTRQTDGSADKRDHYTGKAITINDNRGVCAHSARCTDGLKPVFKYGEEPWIDPDGASKEETIKTVSQCPSGALSYTVDGVEHADFGRDPAITVTKNGPYAVVGGVGLKDSTAGQQPEASEHYTLCRCGGSKNKPFCDGTHWKGFKDDKN
jgi:CDGSH-type Zn-finger protein